MVQAKKENNAVQSIISIPRDRTNKIRKTVRFEDSIEPHAQPGIEMQTVHSDEPVDLEDQLPNTIELREKHIELNPGDEDIDTHEPAPESPNLGPSSTHVNVLSQLETVSSNTYIGRTRVSEEKNDELDEYEIQPERTRVSRAEKAKEREYSQQLDDYKKKIKFARYTLSSGGVFLLATVFALAHSGSQLKDNAPCILFTTGVSLIFIGLIASVFAYRANPGKLEEQEEREERAETEANRATT